MKNIYFKGVSKAFEDEVVVNNLSLEIPQGKFFALLGPSGCGKTTLLRLLAGLESVDSGKIYLGNQDITNVPIYERRIHTVFQNYALFPHLSVFENIAYSLRLRGISGRIVREKVYRILELMRLKDRESRRVQSLSGGQQQRVALARAIINEPEVLLLDEPLAALDLKLKEEMLIELIDLQDKVKTTFVYVTHDQVEALTVADKMAIMNSNGELEQMGTPKEIYEFPTSRFVANFVGSTNFLNGILRPVNNKLFKVEVEELGAFLVFVPTEKNWMIPGGHVYMSLRPEKIEISKACLNGFSNFLTGTVVDIIYYGQATKYRVELSNKAVLTVFEQNEQHFPQENIDYYDVVNLYFQKENAALLER